MTTSLSHDIDARLALAERIAHEAGELALRYFRNREQLTVESKRTSQDVVSEADRNVETLIRDAISQRFPEDAQLGEEHGLSPGTSGLTWIVDPIDGTAPYLAGMPGWCVSIAVSDAEGPLIGVIRVPVLDESFVARRGAGASLNGAPIRVTESLGLRDGLLGVGANDRVPAESVGEMLADLMAAGASWTRYGSGALMLAWVAAGRLVGYAEPRMSAWDCMAGYCLIDESGGRVLPFPDGSALTAPAPVLGASRRTYDELSRLVRFNDAWRWEKMSVAGA